VVAWDYTQIEAIRPTYADEITGLGQMLDRKVLTPNEVRVIKKYGAPLDGGDKVIEKAAPAPGMNPFASQKPQAAEDEPAETVRGFGKHLYQQQAVRAFVAHGSPLNSDALIGHPVSDAVRLAIEDGLRRRYSAEQIATALQETSHV
jgi:hypothetical protein